MFNCIRSNSVLPCGKTHNEGSQAALKVVIHSSILTKWNEMIDVLFLCPSQEQRRCVDGTLQREVKKVRKARNRRQEWNMMALDKELRPDHRHTIHRDRGASSEGSMSPENRWVTLIYILLKGFTCLHNFNFVKKNDKIKELYSITFTLRFFYISPSFCLYQGSRSWPAPLPQLHEPCRPRSHLLRPPAQRPGCTDGCGTRPSWRRWTWESRQDYDGLSEWDTGPFSPPPSSTASSAHRGYERGLHVPSTNGLQVNIQARVDGT